MSNCRLHYLNSIHDDIYNIIGIGRTSAIPIKHNSILLPIGGKDNDNKSLKSKNNTYYWAQRVQNIVNTKYNSEVFGNLISIDNMSNDKGTILNITIPSKLIDSFEVKNGQMSKEDFDKEHSKRMDEGNQKFNEEGDIYFQTNSTSVSKKNDKLDVLLKEYLTINGIELEYLSTLLDKFGGDYTAAYFRGVKEIISINSRREKYNTLAEEVAHSLVEGLGDDNFLVKKAMNLLSKTDYKSKLDPQYIKLYKNNEKALQKEYIGKLIAETLVHKFEPTTQEELNLLDTILKLIDKFISLFKPSDRTSQIDSIVDELATKIINKDKIVQVSANEPYNIAYFQVNEKSKVSPEFKKEYIYFKRRLQEIKLSLQSDKITEDRRVELTEEQDKIKKSLDELVTTGNKQILIDLATELLSNLETKFIEKLESHKIDINKIHADDVTYAVDTLKAFEDLEIGSKKLYKRLEPFIEDFATNQVGKYASEEKAPTKAEIASQNKDINRLIQSFGALADLGNYLARTIGAIIKEAQNKVSTMNKKIADKIKDEVDLLRKYNDIIGTDEKDMYNVFTQVYKGTTVLTRQYTTEFYDLLDKSFKDKNKSWRKSNAIYNPETKIWSPISNKYNNPNYTTIQNTPELKRFFDFHKELTSLAAKKLPVKIGENFIANIKRTTLMDIISSNPSKMGAFKDAISNITDISSQEFNNEDFIGDEELFQDVVPLKYIAKIGAQEKSKDLGENLLTFVSFANSYAEMSNVLPKTRLLQEEIKKKSYIKSNNPKVKILGDESNIFKMTDDYIKMQVKGEMKKDEAKIPIKSLYDENGNKVGEKYIHGSDIIDFGLKYNSLLRIGLNPFNAITNVFIGDIGNITEAFGGRFFGIKDLKNATNIFFKQNFEEDSQLYHWLEKLNPLQELEDYQNIDKVSLTKKLTADKIKTILYSPQTMGEKFLQTRTMLAMLIKEGYMTPEGITTEEGQKLTEEQLTRFSDKIQRVNQMIHGRYSSRDAATVQQSVLWRMAIQFKKWIPAAIESRVQGKHFDNRLGVEVEGRYRTYFKYFNLMVAKLYSDHEKLKRNELTELDKYNMRKNMTELIIIAGVTLMSIGLGWDDDKVRKKNPYYKFAMSQLNRISGDMLFFYDPNQANKNLNGPFALMKTTGDLLDVIHNIPYAFGIKGSEYTKGPRKHENKELASILDITPILKPIADVIRMGKKDVEYQAPVQQN